MTDRQRIIELRSQNIKRLQAITIRPDGNMVQLTGKNGHGKSSTLDSIWMALGGKDAAPREPIRKGQTSAEITLTLNDLVVTRRFRRTADGDVDTSLQVTSRDGQQTYKAPQTVLDRLVGYLSFDPLEFTRLHPREQFDELRKFVPDVDFDRIDRENKTDYELRTTVNKQAKEARVAASQIEIPEGTPSEPIDDGALIDELKRAGDENATIEQKRINRTRAEADIELRRQEAAEKRAAAEDARRRAVALDEEATKIDELAKQLQERFDALPALPALIDTTQLRWRIDAARATNENVRKLQRRLEKEAGAKRLEEQSAQLTQRMEERTGKKQQAIAAAKMPVPGIEFGDGIVLLNGVPFEQASDGEKLRTSVAIAAAMNPTLRVICVRDGSLLDEDGMALLAQIAEEQDMQVWIERVDSSGAVGFVIEDGALKATDQKQESAA